MRRARATRVTVRGRRCNLGPVLHSRDHVACSPRNKLEVECVVHTPLALARSLAVLPWRRPISSVGQSVVPMKRKSRVRTSHGTTRDVVAKSPCCHHRPATTDDRDDLAELSRRWTGNPPARVRIPIGRRPPSFPRWRSWITHRTSNASSRKASWDRRFEPGTGVFSTPDRVGARRFFFRHLPRQDLRNSGFIPHFRMAPPLFSNQTTFAFNVSAPTRAMTYAEFVAASSGRDTTQVRNAYNTVSPFADRLEYRRVAAALFPVPSSTSALSPPEWSIRTVLQGRRNGQSDPDINSDVRIPAMD